MADAMQIRNAEYAKLLEYEGKRWLLEDYLIVLEEMKGIDRHTLANGEERYCWPVMWDDAVECVCANGR